MEVRQAGPVKERSLHFLDSCRCLAVTVDAMRAQYSRNWRCQRQRKAHRPTSLQSPQLALEVIQLSLALG
jgi:hypothetical protein